MATPLTPNQMLAELSAILDAEVREGGVLTLPSHEPYGFDRARGVLAADLEAAIPLPCGVVGHAPDCECATL